MLSLEIYLGVERMEKESPRLLLVKGKKELDGLGEKNGKGSRSFQPAFHSGAMEQG